MLEYHLIISNEDGESIDLYTDEGIRLAPNGFDGIGFSNEILSSKVHGYDGTVYQGSQLLQRTMSIMARYRGPTWKHEMHKNRLSRLVGEERTLKIRYITPNIDVYIKGYVERVNTPPNVRPMITQISIICTDPYWRESGDNTTMLAGTRKRWMFPLSISPVRKQTDSFVAEGQSITLNNAVVYPFIKFNFYGKSIQGGAPTPKMPVDIVSVGDDGAVSVTACGKNLLPYPYVYDSMEISGLRFTVNADTTITISGTTTAMATFRLYGSGSNTEALAGVVGGKTYKLSKNVACKVVNSAGQARYVNTTVTIAEDEIITYVYVQYGANVTVNTTLYPMIYLADTADTFESYNGSTAEITSGLPLCSVGNVRDELIYNADGTGKIIKRVNKVVINDNSVVERIEFPAGSGFYRFNINPTDNPSFLPPLNARVGICNVMEWGVNPLSSNDVNNRICTYSNGGLYARCDSCQTVDEFKSLGIVVIYPLATPLEIELSASEMAELQGLQTFDGITNILNDEGAEMQLRYKGVIE